MTEGNVQELVQLTNQEIEKEKGEDEHAMKIIDQRMAEIDRKLDRLYDVLESGTLDPSDIAPRLKKYKEEKEELQKFRDELLEGMEGRKPFHVTAEIVKMYVQNLHKLLEHSELAQKKEFFRSFIQNIIIDYSEVVVKYRFPAGDVVNYGMAQKKKTGPHLNDEVLSMFCFGSPNRTRTYNLVVNSHPLYRLSYRGSNASYIPKTRCNCKRFFYFFIIICNFFPPIFNDLIGIGLTPSLRRTRFKVF